MNTNTKVLLAAVAGIIIGATGVILFYPKTDSESADMQHVTSADSMTMEAQMSAMTQGLDGKTGDAFDREFLSEMIVHHQGAVSMAQAALQSAKHQEIKDLAQNIITAQNTEIQQMQDWQRSWYNH